MSIFTKPQIPLGIDISERSIKLVQLIRDKKRIKIGTYCEIKMPAGLVVGGEIKEQEKVATLIKKLTGKIGGKAVKHRMVVSCLPEQQTFLKLLKIEKVPEDQLREKIKAEIINHVPLSIEEVYFDWQVIREVKNTLEVIVGIAPQNIIEEYTTLLQEAGLMPIALEIEAQAIIRALTKPQKNIKEQVLHTTAFLDLGAVRSSFIAANNKTIFFTVSLPISGQKITQEIANSLKLEGAIAEKTKLQCRLGDKECNPAITKIMSSAVTQIVSNIQSSISFFNTHFPARRKIENITLCGGGANIANIEKILSQKVNLNIYRADPFINVDPPTEKKKKTANNFLPYITAIGLALRYANKKDII